VRLARILTGEIVKYQGPLLQSHGDQDQTIPFALGEKLFRDANEPKTMIVVANADHNNWLSEDYMQRLNEFINRVGPARKHKNNMPN